MKKTAKELGMTKKELFEVIKKDLNLIVVVTPYEVRKYVNMATAACFEGCSMMRTLAACDRKGGTYKNRQWYYGVDYRGQQFIPKTRKNTNAKPVKAVDTRTGAILHFKSISEASSTLSVPSSNITMACRGKIKSAGGFEWEYVL